MSDTREATSDAGAAPVGSAGVAGREPLRFWWLKRLFVGGLAYLALLVALRGVAGWHTERAWERRVAAVRAAGEADPVGGARATGLPGAENAAVDLLAAADAVVDSIGTTAVVPTFSERVDLRTLALRPAFVAQNVEAFAELVWANAVVLRLLAIGCRKPATDWGSALRMLDDFTVFRRFHKQAQLVQLTVGAAFVAHLEGHDFQAIEHIHDALTLAERYESVTAAGLSHVAAQSGWHCAANTLGDVLPALSLDGESRLDLCTPSTMHVPATRDRLASLIERLLDERGQRVSLALTMHGDRAALIDEGARFRAAPHSSPRFAGWDVIRAMPRAASLLFEPYWTAELCGLLDRGSRQVAATEVETWGAAKLLLHPMHVEPDDSCIALVSIGPEWANSLGSLVRQDHMVRAQRRMAACAIALRLYAVDHGNPAERLEQLVPEYLTAVPRDPFAQPERPISYRTDGSPRLYCVGENETDDLGASAGWNSPDIVYFLGADDAWRSR